MGVEVVQSDRGGDVTFHGPGQLVVYPIIRLNDHKLSVGGYVRLLQEVVIDSLRKLGVVAHRDESAIGVWVGDGDRAEKICALGVRIRRGISMHGLAHECHNRLELFQPHRAVRDLQPRGDVDSEADGGEDAVDAMCEGSHNSSVEGAIAKSNVTRASSPWRAYSHASTEGRIKQSLQRRFSTGFRLRDCFSLRECWSTSAHGLEAPCYEVPHTSPKRLASVAALSRTHLLIGPSWAQCFSP